MLHIPIVWSMLLGVPGRFALRARASEEQAADDACHYDCDDAQLYGRESLSDFMGLSSSVSFLVVLLEN